MLALNARLRVWVAAEPADFRCGIDGLVRRVRQRRIKGARVELTIAEKSVTLALLAPSGLCSALAQRPFHSALRWTRTTIFARRYNEQRT